MSKTKIILAVLVLFASFLVYSGAMFGGLRAYPDGQNYFKDLAMAFNQGRLDIASCPPGTECYDMVVYKGKNYLYQPPVPALVYSPLVALFGRDTPDALINAFFGAVNALLVYFVIYLLARRLGYDVGPLHCFALALFWAFGTVHFYMSMIGSVWYVAQVFGQTFLLMSMLCMFLACTPLSFLASGIFFALAVWTKNDLLFYGIFMAAAAWTAYGNRLKKGEAVRLALLFIAPLAVATAAILAYNGARFDGNLLENGIRYHKMNPAFIEDFNRYGYLSMHYMPYNFFTEVIQPPKFIDVFPFFDFDTNGFGFLWASPLFLAALVSAGLWNKFNEKGRQWLLTGTLASLVMIMLLIFMIMGNGWAQFASRYSLDYQFLLLFLMLPAVSAWRSSRVFNLVFMALLLLSVFINYFGVRYYVL